MLLSVSYTLTSLRLSFLCNAHALLTNPLRCPDTNRIHVAGRIQFYTNLDKFFGGASGVG